MPECTAGKTGSLKIVLSRRIMLWLCLMLLTCLRTAIVDQPNSPCQHRSMVQNPNIDCNRFVLTRSTNWLTLGLLLTSFSTWYSAVQ